MRSALSLKFFMPVISKDRRESYNPIDLIIQILSLAHKGKSLQDRYFVLLMACKLLIAEAVYLESIKEPSPLLALYGLQWFVGLWNETQVQGIEMSYKEELSIALLESTLALHGHYPEQQQEFENVCLEVGEITAKILDWKTTTLNKNSPCLAEFVATKYFHFVELMASNVVSKSEANERMQRLLTELFKRLLNSRAQQEDRVLSNLELPVAQA